MNKKTLKVLEYNKVIEIVANFAYSDMGKEKILSLVPMSDIEEIEEALRETSEAVSIIPVSYTHLDVYKRQDF